MGYDRTVAGKAAKVTVWQGLWEECQREPLWVILGSVGVSSLGKS